MDLPSPNYFNTPPFFACKSNEEATFKANNHNFDGNPSSIEDPVCKLNLKETSEFVKSFPVVSRNGECTRLVEVSGQRRREDRRMEGPSTPGRPVFRFSSNNFGKRNFPSKWDEAEKWLSSSSSSISQDSSKIHKVQCDEMRKQIDVFEDKSRVFVSSQYSEPSKQGFVFRNSVGESLKDASTEVIHEVKLKDIGTDMSPLGSCTASRCHTPFKSTSPARHNTPITRSGLLALACNNSIDMSHLPDSHFVKLQQYDMVTSNWSSREEEEEEISKSLRHFEIGTVCRKGVSDYKAAMWEEEERSNCCLRYQREEARIEAWVNLQSAKAEAQSKKLEVKIERMRSKVEEKLMKRMGQVQRKARELRAEARQHHHLHTLQNNPPTRFSSPSCVCFPR